MYYSVRSVRSRKELNDFLSLPQIIYRGNQNWIAPFKSEVKRILDSTRYPFFRNANIKLLICYRGKEIVTRIAIIINKEYEEQLGFKKALFGFFESINDAVAIKYLFDEVEKYCSQNSIEYLEGPFNPNHYSELGILIDSFDNSPTFFETYNLEYYNSLLEYTGFTKSKIIHTRINKNIREYILKRYGEDPIVEYGDYSTRSFNMQNFRIDLENLRNVFNDAFRDNWSFLTVSKEEYLFSSKYLKLVTPPDLIKFVEYKNEVVAAVHFALNINPLLKQFNGKFNPIKYFNLLNERKNIQEAVLFAVGIKNCFKKTKVYPIILNETLNIAKKFKVLETTWIDENNAMSVNAAKKLGLIKKKNFVIYRKKIS